MVAPKVKGPLTTTDVVVWHLGWGMQLTPPGSFRLAWKVRQKAPGSVPAERAERARHGAAPALGSRTCPGAGTAHVVRLRRAARDLAVPPRHRLDGRRRLAVAARVPAPPLQLHRRHLVAQRRGRSTSDRSTPTTACAARCTSRSGSPTSAAWSPARAPRSSCCPSREHGPVVLPSPPADSVAAMLAARDRPPPGVTTAVEPGPLSAGTVVGRSGAAPVARPAAGCRCGCRAGRSAWPSRAASRWPPRSRGPCPGRRSGRAGRSGRRCRRRGRGARRSGTTSVTRPICCAVAAVSRSSDPISAHRSTSPSGTPRCSMPIGSTADTIDPLACGSKKVASSPAITMSHSLTMYWPPPAHMPCTAQTTGFHTLLRPRARGTRPDRRGSRCCRRATRRPALTSRPVQNARSPLARSTATWMSSVSRTVTQARWSSSHMVRSKAFIRSGRFSVIVATCASTVELDGLPRRGARGSAFVDRGSRRSRLKIVD